MAAPSAPTISTYRRGALPQTAYAQAATVATAATYALYLKGVTGVSKSDFAVKRVSTKPTFENVQIPVWPEVFMVMTAINASAEESSDSAEVEISGGN